MKIPKRVVWLLLPHLFGSLWNVPVFGGPLRKQKSRRQGDALGHAVD